ncbi:hypothetical protein FGO68_gene11789 [Halteria grandinella]|uniref:Uncharacterized protein n=1 Tax=Halteria grandinella TaxID=5974 RepID=A0A8J8NI86_HALGN|nr:hypothetical protein FGO68_gene11789 [Halteria grandinella]
MSQHASLCMSYHIFSHVYVVVVGLVQLGSFSTQHTRLSQQKVQFLFSCIERQPQQFAKYSGTSGVVQMHIEMGRRMRSEKKCFMLKKVLLKRISK